LQHWSYALSKDDIDKSCIMAALSGRLLTRIDTATAPSRLPVTQGPGAAPNAAR
jgi:hypothetical protein